MVGHGGSSAGSYLADPTSPIPSHCASIVVTSTLRVNGVTVNIRQMLISFINISSYSDGRDNRCTVGGDGGCRVGEVRAGTTSPMPDHKGFKLQ